MIVEYVRYELQQHTPQEFVDAYRAAEQSLRQSPECLGYELTQCLDDAPNVFVLRILWTSKEDHLRGFRGGPNFRAFFQAVQPFFHEIAEMRHYGDAGLSWTR